MPTGMKPYRRIYSSGTWTTTNMPAGQRSGTIYIPVYQIRNTPDRVVRKYINALILGGSDTFRQKIASNGYEIEVSLNQVTDGVYQSSQRPAAYIWSFAGATAVGGSQTSIAGGAEERNDKNYTGSCANMWHEMLWAELGIYFPPGQRPAGKTQYTLISDWPEVVQLITDSVGNGASGAFATDPPSFCNVMRCGQRTEYLGGTPSGSIPFNATNAQVKTALQMCPFIRVNPPQDDIIVTGGPLPSPITITFQGQYANSIVGMTIGVNSLSPGAPALATTTVGSPARSGTYGNGTTYNISAASTVFSLTTTGSPTNGLFALNFLGGIDRMLRIVGPGTNQATGNTGGTPQSRVDRWTQLGTTFGWNP